MVTIEMHNIGEFGCQSIGGEYPVSMRQSSSKLRNVILACTAATFYFFFAIGLRQPNL